MKGCIRDKLKETVNDALRTDWRRHGRMHWRQIRGNLNGCRRQIGETWKEALQTFEGDTRRHRKETLKGDTRRHVE